MLVIWAASTTYVIVEQISRLQLIQHADTSTTHTIWQDTDPTGDASSAGSIFDFRLDFDETAYQVDKVRIWVDASQGTPAIDAVRLLTGGTATVTIVSSDAILGNGYYVSTSYMLRAKFSSYL